MSIPVKCSVCGAEFAFPEPTAGMTAKCSACGGSIKVPALTKPPKPPPPPPPHSEPAPGGADELEPLPAAAPWEELFSKGLDEEVAADPTPPPAEGAVGDIPLQSPLEPPPSGQSPGQLGWGISNRLPLAFLRSRWLMVLVLAAAMVLVVWQTASGKGLPGAICLLLALGIVGIGFLPRNESVETLLAKIFGFSLGGLLILTHLGDLAAVWSRDMPPEYRAQVLGFIGGKLLVGLVVIALLFWSCARFGFHRALAWSYIGLVVLLPIGLTTIWSHLKPTGDVAAMVDRPEAPPPVLTPAGGKPGLAGVASFDLSSVPLPEFPARPPMEDLMSGVAFAEIDLGVPAGEVGQCDTLYLYLPEGEHEAHCLPCVLIAPAGSNLISGMELGQGDQPEHTPYVEAGFAVVAYEIDGPMYGETIGELKCAYEEFARAQAGLINARNALEYVLKQVPEVDPQRIYAAGHSSAGTLALLWAAHESRISGCVAYAPVSDLSRHFEEALPELQKSLPGIEDFVVGASPIEYAALLKCPVMLFHSTVDETTPFVQSSTLRASIMAAGGDVTMRATRRGNHYNSMIGQGIPAAIDWLRGLALAKADGAAATADETASRWGHTGDWSNDPSSDNDSQASDTDSSDGPADGDFRDEFPMTPSHGVPGIHLPRAAGPSEKAMREYGRQAHVDLIVGDGTELIDRLGWFAAAKQPVIGLRWGLGVYWTGRPQQPRIASQVDLYRVTGPIGPGLLAVLNERYTEGHFGDWPEQGDPQLRQAVLLGAGTRAELLDAAARYGLDLLVSMELDTKAIGLTGRTDTTMRVRLVDVSTRKPLLVSKPVGSSRLMAAHRMGIDASAQFVDEIAKQIESEFSLAPMPKLQAEHVQRRVGGLDIDSPSTEEALRLLAELRYYQAKQLLSAEDAQPLYEKILGDGKGSVLAGGEESERRGVLEGWLKGR